jgi:hypothetical protein
MAILAVAKTTERHDESFGGAVDRFHEVFERKQLITLKGGELCHTSR